MQHDPISSKPLAVINGHTAFLYYKIILKLGAISNCTNILKPNKEVWCKGDHEVLSSLIIFFLYLMNYHIPGVSEKKYDVADN